MPLFVAGKIAAARRVGYPPHGGIVLPSVPKLGNGIRRHLIAIIFSAAADIFFDGAVRRHDIGKGIDDALIAEELGVGGFMGVQDVKPGMKITIALNDDSSKKEYAGEVVDCSGKDLFVTAENGVKDFVDKKNKHELCKLHIVVDNVLYYWDDIEIHPVRQGEKGQYKLHIESNPKVYNRRKYPRMPISNACTIRLEGTDKTYSGKMVNISANGFAFSVRDNVFASQKGRNVQLDVKDFAVIGNKPLTGCVIRSSNNEGEFIVGCRMPEDSEAIKEYVSRNYNGN